MEGSHSEDAQGALVAANTPEKEATEHNTTEHDATEHSESGEQVQGDTHAVDAQQGAAQGLEQSSGLEQAAEDGHTIEKEVSKLDTAAAAAADSAAEDHPHPVADPAQEHSTAQALPEQQATGHTEAAISPDQAQQSDSAAQSKHHGTDSTRSSSAGAAKASAGHSASAPKPKPAAAADAAEDKHTAPAACKPCSPRKETAVERLTTPTAMRMLKQLETTQGGKEEWHIATGVPFKSKRLSPDAMSAMVDRLCMPKHESDNLPPKPHAVKLVFEGNKEVLVPVKESTKDENITYMSELYARCQETRAKTQQSLQEKWLQPLIKPKQAKAK